MPTFEVEINGRLFEVDAPSLQAAAARVRPLGAAVGRTAPSAANAFGMGESLGQRTLDPNRQAPPETGPAPQGDVSYRLGRAGDLLNNTVRSVASGVPVLGGLADRAAGPSESFDQFQQDHPVASKVLPVAGAIAGTAPLVAMAPGAFGVGTGALLPRMAVGAATGGAIQGADAAARGQNVGEGALAGAITGAAAPAIGDTVGKVFGSRAAQNAAPSTQELRAQSNAAYDAADNAGVVVPPATLQRLRAELLARLRAEHYQPPLHREITNGLRVVDQMARGPVSLRDLDGLRQALRDIGGTAPNNQGRLAGVMVRGVDDFVSRLSPADVVTGNPQAGVAALTEARGLWSRMSKGEVIEQLIDNARLAPQTTSWTDALRTQFRSLARDPDAMQQFSQAEQAAIRTVVQGGAIENGLNIIGKLAPHTLLGIGMGGGAGYVAAGPLGAGMAPIVGEAGRQVSSAMTRNNAAIASALARSGPAYGQTAARAGGQAALRTARMAAALLTPAAQTVRSFLPGM
jgi:hypothetical protein